jgi:NADH:ubiquinone oxidoreductase subunit 2 (subunit N)
MYVLITSKTYPHMPRKLGWILYIKFMHICNIIIWVILFILTVGSLYFDSVKQLLYIANDFDAIFYFGLFSLIIMFLFKITIMPFHYEHLMFMKLHLIYDIFFVSNPKLPLFTIFISIFWDIFHNSQLYEHLVSYILEYFTMSGKYYFNVPDQN